MKTNILYLSLSFSLLLLFAACSSNVDKRAELDKLKKQQDQIADQIKKLESELKVTDSTNIKY